MKSVSSSPRRPAKRLHEIFSPDFYAEVGMERRVGGRVAFRNPIKVKPRGGSSTYGPGMACDLNETGARLVVHDEVQPGGSLIVYLKLEARRMLHLIGKVVWTRTCEHGTEVGLCFEEGCRRDRLNLARWLHCQRLTGPALA